METDNTRGALLLTLVVLAGLATIGALYLRADAREAARTAEAARERLDEGRLLAAEYRDASPDKLVISADVTEAQSSEYIPEALRRNGISPSGITYSNPQETSGKFSKVTTEINIKGVKFAAICKFLKDVQQGRPQLRLLEAKLTREGGADKWSGSLTYGALIRAIPRS